jgi:hypothetical protein
MGKFWLKLWIWTKVLLFSMLLIYSLLFITSNHSNTAKVWVWPYRELTSSTLNVALFAFLAGVIGTILVRTTFKTVRQIRDVQDRTRHEKLQREVEDMKAKASMLRPKPPAPESHET